MRAPGTAYVPYGGACGDGRSFRYFASFDRRRQGSTAAAAAPKRALKSAAAAAELTGLVAAIDSNGSSSPPNPRHFTTPFQQLHEEKTRFEFLGLFPRQRPAQFALQLHLFHAQRPLHLRRTIRKSGRQNVVIRNSRGPSSRAHQLRRGSSMAPIHGSSSPRIGVATCHALGAHD